MITFAHRLPQPVSVPLFGDRRRFGKVVNEADADWIAWTKTLDDFYQATQRDRTGELVNGLGYRVMGALDLQDKDVLEIGPGDLDHLPFCKGKPRCFHLADVHEPFLERASARLSAAGISNERHKIESRAPGLPFADASMDVVVSFYSLEHLHPLQDHLDEIVRVLRPAGVLIGGIPCEGGLAWGLGRFLTSRRWLMSRGVNMDKIICWEHPNFAETIIRELDSRLQRKHLSLAPFVLPLLDFNLIARFIYEKRATT